MITTYHLYMLISGICGYLLVYLPLSFFLSLTVSVSSHTHIHSTIVKSKTPTKTPTKRTTTTANNNKTTDYVSQEAMDNLKYYKYGSADKSYLTFYVLQPYWSWAVQFFPLWMAPNCITLTGLGFMVVNLALYLWTMPDLEGPVDSWIYFRYPMERGWRGVGPWTSSHHHHRHHHRHHLDLTRSLTYYADTLDTIHHRCTPQPYVYRHMHSFAIGLWLYSTFDNVDGKQARRTGTSSPLGELFDHGWDALNCSVRQFHVWRGDTDDDDDDDDDNGTLPYRSTCTVETRCRLPNRSEVSSSPQRWDLVTRGCPIPFLAIVAFFFSTWEYHTGILYLGHINGPTEGLVLACLCIVLSGVYGMSWGFSLLSSGYFMLQRGDYSLQTIKYDKGPHIWKLSFHSVAPTLLSAYVPKSRM